ncbi:MAG: hypothetical protein WCI93_03025 [bacterium]
MKLNKEIYYYCKLYKKTCTLKKIRIYCSEVDCPHLGQRRKKNKDYGE